MKLYVLAAGYATRLYPLTRDRPKALLEIAGRPLLSRLLERFVALDDLSEIAVVTNHRFVSAFEAWRRDFACRVPVRVLDDGTTQEPERLGASGDLAFALREMPLDGEDFAAVAGDNLLDFDVAPLAARFRSDRKPLLVLRHVDVVDGPSPYNEVTLAADGSVRRMREKPASPVSDLAAIALYFYPAWVQTRLDTYLSEGGNPDAPGHFAAWLVERESVAAARFDGRWFDIGTIEALEAARDHFGG